MLLTYLPEALPEFVNAYVSLGRLYTFFHLENTDETQVENINGDEAIIIKDLSFGIKKEDDSFLTLLKNINL